MHVRETGERHGAVRGPRTPTDGDQRYVHTASETAHRRHGAACELRHIKKTDPAIGGGRLHNLPSLRGRFGASSRTASPALEHSDKTDHQTALSPVRDSRRGSVSSSFAWDPRFNRFAGTIRETVHACLLIDTQWRRKPCAAVDSPSVARLQSWPYGARGSASPRMTNDLYRG